MDELHPKLRSLLDAARDADDPDERAARRVRAAIGVAISAGAGAGTGGDGGQASALDRVAAGGARHSVGATGKWIGALLIAGGLGTLAAFQLGRDAPAAPSSRGGATEHAPPAALTPPPAAQAPGSQPLAGQSTPAPPVAEPEPQAQAPAERAKARRPARVQAAPAEGAVDPAAPQEPSELQLIRNATGALRDGRAQDALQLLEQHGRLYPDGMLRQEREGLRVLALCGAGRIEQGRDERERFLSAAAHSPLAGRVRAACTEPEAP